jgi:hypothetical protein
LVSDQPLSRGIIPVTVTFNAGTTAPGSEQAGSEGSSTQGTQATPEPGGIVTLPDTATDPENCGGVNGVVIFLIGALIVVIGFFIGLAVTLNGIARR